VQIATYDQLHARAFGIAAIADIAPLVAAFAGDVYLVGGAVRDLIIGREFIDVDLAVDGEPSQLAAGIGNVEPAETKFGTSSVQRGGYRYDLARTRRESYPQPGALPEVAPAGIDADLRRRDFTVNALALGLSGSRAGELIVADGALDDLESQRLAVLHDRSFLDDPTRLLRLARYAARLGFSIAPHTRELATEAISSGALDSVSGPRIGSELRLLASEPDPIAAFNAASNLGLPWEIDGQLAASALEALPSDGRPDLLVLATVFGGQRSEQLIAELDRLGFTATDRDAIAQAATQSASLAERLARTHSNSEIARTVGTSGIETVALASGQGSPSQSLTWLQDLRHRQLQINGDDLIDHGIPEGPKLGHALQAARDALLDGTASDRDSQLKVALKTEE
jgi:tRNA nucleotidyltransferase (CCA-adding enzyme)